MSNMTAQAVVLQVWNGARKEDNVFHAALKILGITPETYRRLKREMGKLWGKFPRNLILTPTSVGKRR